MKRTVLLLLATATFACSTRAFGQNGGFEQAMQTSFAQLDSARTIDDYKSIAAQFERIAINEPRRWEPLYYRAFALINVSFMSTDSKEKDDYLDVAQTCIDKALELKGDKSELLTLQGWLYQGRISASPSRGMTYSMKAGDILRQAIELNPKNPRALFLYGMNVYHTPKMFGGGSQNATKYFQDASVLFRDQKQTGLHPRWGNRSNDRMLETCKKES